MDEIVVAGITSRRAQRAAWKRRTDYSQPGIHVLATGSEMIISGPAAEIEKISNENDGVVVWPDTTDNPTGAVGQIYVQVRSNRLDEAAAIAKNISAVRRDEEMRGWGYSY